MRFYCFLALFFFSQQQLQQQPQSPNEHRYPVRFIQIRPPTAGVSAGGIFYPPYGVGGRPQMHPGSLVAPLQSPTIGGYKPSFF